MTKYCEACGMPKHKHDFHYEYGVQYMECFEGSCSGVVGFFVSKEELLEMKSTESVQNTSEVKK